ncbi:hypothetical protein ACJ73_00482 [Blastomyces percursus]|uniref:Retrotransposon gag domain-containing protein n=1 Tax=Blastomyces percursus TaxID=1658174 RepID=A0A1J9QHZ1_9EURO|nr:hypothetical protein ACJ73_00482 [Blastomyces percursus]
MPMPIPGAPGAPFFDGNNATAFVNRYEAMCTLHAVTGLDALAVFRSHCTMELQGYIDQLVLDCKTWDGVKKQLLAYFWCEDAHQQMYNQSYLHALCNKIHSGQESLVYCRQFRAVALPLIKKNELQQSLACIWFLQGLPQGVREKAFRAAGFDKINQSEWELLKVCNAVSETQRTKEDIARALAPEVFSRYAPPPASSPQESNPLC